MSNEEDEVDVMTDADFENAMEALRMEGGEDVGELLKMMNENRIISWEEAERILGDTDTQPVKSSLPQQTRPTEPDNDTNVDYCIQRLMNNDPKLLEINLNNMKRTPIPQIKRVIEAIRDNQYLEKLSLANMGLYDMDVMPLIDLVENNDVIRSINLETNYISGDFFAKLFKAALIHQSLEEIKVVNQGVSFSTTAEKEIIDAIENNRGLTKVSINLRMPEGRYKIEKATIRNQEIRRILRRQDMMQQQQKASVAEPSTSAKAGKIIGDKKDSPVKKIAEEKKSPATTKVEPKKTPALGAASKVSRQSFESQLAVAGATSALSVGKQLYEKKDVNDSFTSPTKPKGSLPPFGEKKTGAVSERAKLFGAGASNNTEAALPPKPSNEKATTEGFRPKKSSVSDKESLSKSTLTKSNKSSNITDSEGKSPPVKPRKIPADGPSKVGAKKNLLEKKSSTETEESKEEEKSKRKKSTITDADGDLKKASLLRKKSSTVEENTKKKIPIGKDQLSQVKDQQKLLINDKSKKSVDKTGEGEDSTKKKAPPAPAPKPPAPKSFKIAEKMAKFSAAGDAPDLFSSASPRKF